MFSVIIVSSAVCYWKRRARYQAQQDNRNGLYFFLFKFTNFLNYFHLAHTHLCWQLTIWINAWTYPQLRATKLVLNFLWRSMCVWLESIYHRRHHRQAKNHRNKSYSKTYRKFQMKFYVYKRELLRSRSMHQIKLLVDEHYLLLERWTSNFNLSCNNRNIIMENRK